LLHGQVEIWVDGVLITRHEQVHRRAVVRLPGQYEGLKAAQGHAFPRPMACQISVEQVETRSLELYDRLAEVSA